MSCTLPFVRITSIQMRVFVALFIAVCFILAFPGTSEAHAILFQSDPAANAVLIVPPDQVRLWFSESLNPAFSTVAVVNEANQRIDNHDAQISPDNTSEMDVTLPPNLSPGVYVVVWRSDANDDGHILTSSFEFTIANPDGTIPILKPGTLLGQNVLGGDDLSGQYTGQLDGPTLFNLLVITLVELGAVFWVGASIWLLFILQPVSEAHPELQESNRHIQQRFEQRWLFPVLLVLLLANGGELVGQALTITGGDWKAAFNLALLGELITSSSSGIFWLIRVILLLLAVRLAFYHFQFKHPPRFMQTFLSWANLLLGLALFIAIAMSSHAASVTGNLMLLAVIVDWMHLIAAALWVGGIMTIATIYLPILRRQPSVKQAPSLLTVLPSYSPWAIAGIVMMAVTGPFSATVHLASWMQLLTTAYGRALSIKVLLVGVLLLTSAIHVFWLRPRLRKEYKKYTYALVRHQSQAAIAQSDYASSLLAGQVKLREKRVAQRTERLTRILRIEPVMSVAVLICVGLMNVFAGTLAPVASAPQAQQQTATTATHAYVVLTSDKTLNVTLKITPDAAGANLFVVTVQNATTHEAITNVNIVLSISSLDMDMGTAIVSASPDGTGSFKATGNLLMGGNWQIRVQIRTPDHVAHVAIIRTVVSY
ncbi:MAG: copper resistance protein CopC [Ktedonobacteraceae bacterium]